MGKLEWLYVICGGLVVITLFALWSAGISAGQTFEERSLKEAALEELKSVRTTHQDTAAAVTIWRCSYPVEVQKVYADEEVVKALERERELNHRMAQLLKQYLERKQ